MQRIGEADGGASLVGMIMDLQQVKQDHVCQGMVTFHWLDERV